MQRTPEMLTVEAAAEVEADERENHFRSPFFLHECLMFDILQQVLKWAIQQWGLSLVVSRVHKQRFCPPRCLTLVQHDIACLGPCPTAVPTSALPDSDRPFFLVNSTSMFLMASSWKLGSLSTPGSRATAAPHLTYRAPRGPIHSIFFTSLYQTANVDISVCVSPRPGCLTAQ